MASDGTDETDENKQRAAHEVVVNLPDLRQHSTNKSIERLLKHDLYTLKDSNIELS